MASDYNIIAVSRRHYPGIAKDSEVPQQRLAAQPVSLQLLEREALGEAATRLSEEVKDRFPGVPLAAAGPVVKTASSTATGRSGDPAHHSQ